MFHPHFTHMEDLLKLLDHEPTPGRWLFVSVIAYLSSLSLPPEKDVLHLRATLAPVIQTVRGNVLLNLPADVEACQALQMLTVHAPFGVLPLEQTDLSDAQIARGQLSAAFTIWRKLGVQPKVLQKLEENSMEGLASMYETWLFLNLIAEATAAEIQAERPSLPGYLMEGTRIANMCMAKDLDYIRRHCLGFHKIQVMGRMYLCDRLLRLADTLNTIIKLRLIFESTATDPYFPAFDALRATLNDYLSSVDAREQAFDELLGGSFGVTRWLEADHLADLKAGVFFDGIDDGMIMNRRLSLLGERARVIGAGLRFVYAIGSMPGHPSAIPGLPTKLNAAEKIAHALAESGKPATLLAFLDRGRADPGNHILWQFGPDRGDLLEEINAMVHRDIGPRLAPGTDEAAHGIVIPIHSVLASALDASKVHLEMQSASILVARHGTSDVVSRSPDRANLMKRVIDRIARLKTHALEDGCGGASVEQGFADTISAVYKTSQTYIRLALQANMPPPATATSTSEDSMTLATPRSDDSKEVEGRTGAAWRDVRPSAADSAPLYTLGGPGTAMPSQAYSGGAQQAVDTAERWQNGSGGHPIFPAANHLRPPAAPSRLDTPPFASRTAVGLPQPSAKGEMDAGLRPLDQVLAQMFNMVQPAQPRRAELPGKWAEDFK